MTNTVNISIPQNTWTSITSTLTDEVVYTLQNWGSADVEIFEKSTTPSDTDVGIVLHRRQIITIKPQAGFEIYARCANSNRIVITESA